MTNRIARPLSEIVAEPTFLTIDGVSAIHLPGFGRSERRDTLRKRRPFSSAVSTPDSVVLCEAYNNWLVDYCAAAPAKTSLG